MLQLTKDYMFMYNVYNTQASPRAIFTSCMCFIFNSTLEKSFIFFQSKNIKQFNPNKSAT